MSDASRSDRTKSQEGSTALVQAACVEADETGCKQSQREPTLSLDVETENAEHSQSDIEDPEHSQIDIEILDNSMPFENVEFDILPSTRSESMPSPSSRENIMADLLRGVPLSRIYRRPYKYSCVIDHAETKRKNVIRRKRGKKGLNRSGLVYPDDFE